MTGALSGENLVAILALIGIVIVVASLLSGVVEKTGLPQVAIFLALGALLGPAGFGLFEVTLQSTALQVMATLALLLVLFSDAITMDIRGVRQYRRVAALVLGPGTLLPAAVLAVLAHYLLGISPARSAILGAALASTDPVLLRTLLRSAGLPTETRLILRLESGINDVLLLPIVVIAMLVIEAGGAMSVQTVTTHAAGLFVLGPLLGAGVGWAGISLLEAIRSRVGVRRDYESLYALGVAFTAYAAAEWVGGSGFLAAFAAGLTIAMLDVELCDCFLDYGQATAEMFLLLTFLAFGSSLIWMGLKVVDARTVLFALVAVSIRTLVLLPVLRAARIDRRSQRLIAWLGPRGLSSLLLVLLPVFAGVAGAEQLFAVTCLVVLLSVVLHGGGIALFLRRIARAERDALVHSSAAKTVINSRELPQLDTQSLLDERITIEEVKAMDLRDDPYRVIDVRTEKAFNADDLIATHALRFAPDDAVKKAKDMQLESRGTLVVYCA
jgi:NhaP-type Na+/H+ or K+/H+ antiporter